MKTMRWLLSVMVVTALLLGAANAPRSIAAQDELIVGVVLVGPENDRGWSQAHFDGAVYAENMIPGVKKIVLDKLNPGDRPNVTLEQVVESMVEQGAKIIFTTSDEFGPDTLKAAEAFPDVIFIHVSGDGVLKGVAPKNVGNVMGRMEYMKMAAGCAAALKTETNSIAYLGPLINDETRRLVVSAYLGARYCFETYRGGAAADLSFEVKWIGFWFNLPGVTLDPTEVANGFFNGGADVIISGIDTTEGIVVTKQRADKGEKVYAVPYDYEGACEIAPEVCLGTPFFNWGPSYVKIIQAIKDGTWQPSWDWVGPDWEDINDRDTSAVGFVKGDALGDDNAVSLDTFIAGLGDGSVVLFKGPLNYQDGTVFLKEGEVATDEQVWYLPQLLEGMKGESKPAQ
ncbi:MAG TPA: BMP family ABC transporter substrate-binding protein [Aggregatilineales bacterium]|nr:BMP family ABC transporter substrate-binding protein [Aggregatilineales bacterium]